ncbi:MAG: aminotransferase class V-fold PLP-dependent enzyme [Geobacteraceae bacterium]|nr:aminotransferase class V-fold PLP-dependent enzyme [Geobacteraceae bacterium]
MRQIYMDNNATTPLHAEVVEAMLPCLHNNFGNPSSIHWAGRQASVLLQQARAQVASVLNAEPHEIIFTSCGTEGDNLALFGSADALRTRGNHIITSAVEHPAVLDACRYFEERGGRVTYVAVDSNGRIDPADVEAAIEADTVLISLMWANNETGTVFPIEQLSAMARTHGIRFHTDAVQALGRLPIDVQHTPVDLLSISAHKIGGPKGIGALYVRDGLELSPRMHGGHQEKHLRAGTHNVAGIVGFGRACQWVEEHLYTEHERLTLLRNRLEEGLFAQVEHVSRNGDSENCLPNTLNLTFPYVEGEGLLLALDMVGIAASSGSACTSGAEGASHVLKAMNADDMTLNSSVRLSLGFHNTEDDVEYVVEHLPRVVQRLLAMSPAFDELSEYECDVISCEIDPHAH